MNLDAVPLFSMLKSRLGYLSERQRLISENVANADTPGYAPKDLKAFKVTGSAVVQSEGLPMVRPARTDPAHLAGARLAVGEFRPQEGSDSEVTLDGNKVELEDQMAKMTQARMDYEAAVGFYQKSLEMLRTAARAPGK